MNRNESFIILKTFDLCSDLRQKKKKRKELELYFTIYIKSSVILLKKPYRSDFLSNLILPIASKEN